MFNLSKRIKNLWRLSEFKIREGDFASKRYGLGIDPNTNQLIKDFPTIRKKMATIIPDEKADLFEEEIKDGA